MTKVQQMLHTSCNTALMVVSRTIRTSPGDTEWPADITKGVFWCHTCKTVPDAREIHMGNRPVGEQS